MEHIPEHILDLVQQSGFENLSKADQEQVLKYFTPFEFSQMHEASLLANASSEDLTPDPSVRLRLLDAFDKKYSEAGSAPIWMTYPVQLWKVAAVFLMMAGAGTWLVLKAGAQKQISYITIKDTVYVPSFTGKEKIVQVFDTVYLEGDPDQKSQAGKGVRVRRTASVAAPGARPAFDEEQVGRLNLISFRERDALANRPKGNSLKDDTLLQKFGFVSL